MPSFNDAPKKTDRPKPMDLIRTPTKGILSGIVLAEAITGCETHYWGGRTVPCEHPDCPACDDASPTRWHGYLPIWSPKDNATFIWEFTEQAADALLAYRDKYNTLRGCGIHARRAKPIPNGRIVVSTQPVDLLKYTLPALPDVQKILLTIWNLPGKAFQKARNANGDNTLTPAQEVLNRYLGKTTRTKAVS